MSELFKCQNCSKVWPYHTLPKAKDILQRHEPGDMFSDVECPDCGALCFPENSDAERFFGRLDPKDQLLVLKFARDWMDLADSAHIEKFGTAPYAHDALYRLLRGLDIA